MHPYFVPTNAKFSLKDISPDDARFSEGDEEANKKATKKLSKKIDKLQDVFFANHSKRLLIVLQGTDTSGKDGTVRKVFQYCDPLGIRTYAFKKPTEPELARDYLWRIHQKVPADGEITIFNRSHYEDVLITKVHGWISKAECQARYEHINMFEKSLVDTGTTILKCMLHVSSDMQRQRLQDRIDNPEKHWKFSEGDIKERAHWDDYQNAYEQMLLNTSTDHAPWHVIPSDDKSVRNLVVAQLVHNTLEDMKLEYPAPVERYYSLKLK